MVDRYRVWLGAGVLAGGMSAAMLTGAGVAAAEDGTTSSTGSQATGGSDDDGSSGAVDTQVDADESEAAETDVEETDEEPEESDPADEDVEDAEKAEDAEDSEGGEDAEDSEDVEDTEDSEDVENVEIGEDVDVEDVKAADEEPVQQPEEPTQPAESDDHYAGLTSPFVRSIETDLSSSEGAAVMQTMAVQSPGIVTGLLNLLDTLNDIGTAFYNFYTGAMQFLAGPARAPFGSRVRVESSSLTIGHGSGDEVVVPVDWYFPPGNAEPKGLIYLQHGMLATSAFYGATAAYLAEKTHSIVVAPTLTWNIFDVENLPLMLSHTHKAIADLFIGDRAALTASARIAGYTEALPTKIVLAGHSAGGGLVVGTARYLVERGLEADLAGVVMLDGAGFASLSTDLAKVPRSIPVYNLAAEPDTWNNFGDATRRLEQARPDAFTGIVIAGGRHSDSMQSSSLLVQIAAYVATGFSSPFNIAINQILASGWIGDMLNGTHTPRLYGSSGSAATVAAGMLIGARRVSVTVAPTVGSAATDVCVADRPGSACSSVPAGLWHA
ncbi:alpha/beta hydrolase [Mycobacterium sp. pW049]|uniref:alpha/beta hydrolase n=1 Tax=[Mycobacterium] bulgaricum TaxID=3238985 RepID=UPI00351B6EBC